MECLLQYLDNLDDLIGACGLLWEKARRLLFGLARAVLLIATSAAAVGLALLHPPLALATSTVLFVVLLYRVVTAPTLKSFA
jgi:hypothetical protein